MKRQRPHPVFNPSAPASMKTRYGRMACVLFALTTMLMAASCSSSSGGSTLPVDGSPLVIADPVGSEPLPEVLRLLQQDDEVQAPVPDIAHTQTMANSGLQISYTDTSLMARAPASVIEKQWSFMQTCVGQISPPPLVLVREGPVVPFTRADDVVRNEIITATDITSVPIASASTLHGPVIQVSVDDFDGSLGTPAFNLRSIIGRHLWLTANLPERDYPFHCARQQP